MIGFLFKGLLRDPSRSVYPVLIVIVGVALTVLAQAYTTGIFTSVVKDNAGFATGHLKVMTRAYNTNAAQSPNDLALLDATSLAQQLEREFPQIEWQHRIRFGGLLDVPGPDNETVAQGPVAGMALSLLGPDTAELKRLQVADALVRGRLPEGRGEVLVSDEFAHKLELPIGAQATLIGSTMYGGMSLTNFDVVGTVRFGIEAMDRGMMLADIEDIRGALDMADATGELFGYFRSGQYDDKQARQITEAFNRTQAASSDEFAPVMLALSDQNGLGQLLQISGYYILIATVVFTSVMSLVLWNVGLIGGLRRYGEIGLRLAIGESKPHVYGSVVVEAAMIGLIGSVIGTLLGLAMGSYLQHNPIDIGGLMQNSSIMISSKFGASITPSSYYIGFLPGLLATVIGAGLSGIGIYRRQTAQLFKELET